VKLDFSVDGKQLSLNVNSNKPLHLILMEEVNLESMDSVCTDGMCGNCIVLMNSEAVVSCLIPAFRLKGAKIETIESYQKSRFYLDVERAYEDTGSRPCPRCYAAKTLIFESLLQSMFKKDPGSLEEEELDEQLIVREVGLSRCPCLDAHEMIAIFRSAATYRRRRRVRRY